MRSIPFVLALLATLALADMCHVYPLWLSVSVSSNPFSNLVQAGGAPGPVNFDPNA